MSRWKVVSTAPRACRWPRWCLFGREIAKGLAAAHAHGLIHRDIKPGNVWLDASAAGRVKILDFGLVATALDDQARLTASGCAVGTPAYMAPEQVFGTKVDHRADLYSLGVVLYQMITGTLPARGADTLLSPQASTPPFRRLYPG